MNDELEEIADKWFYRFAKDEPDGTQTIVLHETYGWEADEAAKYKLTQAIEAYISKHYIKKEDVLEAIETNQKGQFEDDAGHICWYLDDLVSAIKKLNIGDK